VLAVSGVIGVRAKHQAQDQERAYGVFTPTERGVDTLLMDKAVSYALEELFMTALI